MSQKKKDEKAIFLVWSWRAKHGPGQRLQLSRRHVDSHSAFYCEQAWLLQRGFPAPGLSPRLAVGQCRPLRPHIQELGAIWPLPLGDGGQVPSPPGGLPVHVTTELAAHEAADTSREQVFYCILWSSKTPELDPPNRPEKRPTGAQMEQ